MKTIRLARLSFRVRSGSAARAQAGPYATYLKRDALKGKRFGVPAFVISGAGVPFQGLSPTLSREEWATERRHADVPLHPETREAFMRAIAGLRAAS